MDFLCQDPYGASQNVKDTTTFIGREMINCKESLSNAEEGSLKVFCPSELVKVPFSTAGIYQLAQHILIHVTHAGDSIRHSYQKPKKTEKNETKSS